MQLPSLNKAIENVDMRNVISVLEQGIEQEKALYAIGLGSWEKIRDAETVLVRMQMELLGQQGV